MHVHLLASNFDDLNYRMQTRHVYIIMRMPVRTARWDLRTQ